MVSGTRTPASGALIGLNRSRIKSHQAGSAQALNKLWEEVVAMCAEKDPRFVFTSIQVNKNFGGRVHRNGNNEGEQMATSLGGFRGGHLFLSTDDPQTYVAVETRNRLVTCDGRHPHWVTEHTGGDRYSLIMYNVVGPWQARSSNLPEHLAKTGARFGARRKYVSRRHGPRTRVPG